MIYILALKTKVKKHSACYIRICLYKNQKQWLEPILAATAGAESYKKFGTFSVIITVKPCHCFNT